MTCAGVGDWVRCTLTTLTSCYGRFARVTAIRENGRGVMVAFRPRQEGWKPHRCVLLEGHYELVDVVTLLGSVVL